MRICKNARWAALALACATVAQAQTTTPATPTPATPTQQAPGSQQGSPDALQQHGEEPHETLQVYSREVDLIFTVTDHKGSFVTGLQQQNFGLLDNGRPPERVVRFTQQTNLPLRVGIMLDTSSSIRQRFQFEQQAATDFLLQVLHGTDRAFVEGFDVQTDIEQDFT